MGDAKVIPNYYRRVYGCDIGTSNVAIGIQETERAGVGSHFLAFDAEADPYEIHETLEGLVLGLSPDPGDLVLIEGVFKGPNQRTFQRLTRVAHSLHVIFASYGCEVRHVQSSTWRKALFGSSRIKKEDAQDYAYRRWGFLQSAPKKERGHRADSLLISLSATGETIDREHQGQKPGSGEPGSVEPGDAQAVPS